MRHGHRKVCNESNLSDISSRKLLGSAQALDKRWKSMMKLIGTTKSAIKNHCD